MSTSAVNVQAVAARGSAAPGDNADADILVLVTDPSTGAAVTSLSQTDFTVVDHFGVPGQTCGFSSNITSFNTVGTGAYQITVATHSSGLLCSVSESSRNQRQGWTPHPKAGRLGAVFL